MIRKCTERDFEEIYQIINDGAQAYKGVIPEDRWHEPYMTRKELQHEIHEGVAFWGFEENSELIGVMGIQDRGDVTLIRHAYVRAEKRNQGIGTDLLRHLEGITDGPILIGTWRDATWAVHFYQKNGYRLVEEYEKNQLLEKYWRIPARQIETSVVLANAIWFRRVKFWRKDYTLESVLNKLKGDDRRSIGRVNEVVDDVLANPDLFESVFNGMLSDDPVLRMRSADAVEKITARHREYLKPYKAQIIRFIAQNEQQEVRWHVAQLFSRLELTPSERRAVVKILLEYLESESKIVKTFTMQVLADIAEQDIELYKPILDKLKVLTHTGSPAMKSRGRKLLARLKRVNPKSRKS